MSVSDLLEIKQDLKEIKMDIRKIEIDIATLKVKSGLWGMLGAFVLLIPVAVGYLITK